MKKVYAFISLVIFLSVSSFNSFAGNNSGRSFQLAPGLTSSDYFPGKIIIKIKPGYRSSCSRSSLAIASLSGKFSSLQMESVEKKFPLHQPPSLERNSNGQKLVDISLIYELKYNADIPIEKAIN